MNCWTRRQFSSLVGAACLTAVAPRVARSQPNARVVVIGGGIGGATVAKYLAANAAGIEVTLVEPKARYTTCFFSALYLAGMRSLESLTHGYETLAQRYGIKIVHDFAAVIDPVAKTVNLKSGGKLPYDRLVLAPGIASNSRPSRATTRPQQKSCHMPGLPGHRPSSCDSNSTAWRMAGFF